MNFEKTLFEQTTYPAYLQRVVFVNTQLRVIYFKIGILNQREMCRKRIAQTAIKTFLVSNTARHGRREENILLAFLFLLFSVVLPIIAFYF